MSTQIAVRLSDKELAAIDAWISDGRYRNRAEAVRAALGLMAREERERVIAESYRRAYGEHPQEEWIGQAGLALAEERLAEAERR